MNKVALVTGAARNTGYSIARRFAKDGYNVVITSRELGSASRAAEKLQAEYPDVKVLPLALAQSDYCQIKEVFAAIGSTFGRLDVYVANAADLCVDMNVFNLTPERWNEIMVTNVSGAFFMAQESAKLMHEGGNIVFISSVHANQSIVGRVAYSTSKAALGGMMRSLALELGHLHIRVNSIIAGAIWSERWETQTPEQTAQRRLKYPTGRESATDEIAHAVAFLCAPESATITGTELTVDSGISVCLLPYRPDWHDAK